WSSIPATVSSAASASKSTTAQKTVTMSLTVNSNSPSISAAGPGPHHWHDAAGPAWGGPEPLDVRRRNAVALEIRAIPHYRSVVGRLKHAPLGYGLIRIEPVVVHLIRGKRLLCHPDLRLVLPAQ